jgi:serine/threonine protein kinase
LVCAGALRVLHGGQTLHRDISPDNIFLQDFGPPVLLDLGAARHAINDRDRKHTAVLKVNYAPIEQYSEGDLELVQDHGATCTPLRQWCTAAFATTPLPSTLRAIRDRMVPFARVAKTVRKQFGQEYSPAFVDAITKALSLQPQDRPQSIDEFLQLMEMTTAPAGLELFDFRAELGDLWVEPTDQPGPGIVVPTVDLTSEVMAAHKPIRPAPVPTPAVELTTPAPAMLDAQDTVALDAGDTVLMEDVADSALLR